MFSYRSLVIITLMLLLAACSGPAPAPKTPAKAAETDERASAVEERRPPAEEPRPEVAAPPKSAAKPAAKDAPNIVDNETVFPKGSEVYVKLSKVESAGRVSGKSELQLQLDRIFLGKKSYLVESNTYENTGESQGGRTARSAGIGAAIGAAI